MGNGRQVNILPVVQMCPKTGNIIAIFKSSLDASYYGFNNRGITLCCRRDVNRIMHKGFFWLYKKDYTVHSFEELKSEFNKTRARKPRRRKIGNEKNCSKCKILKTLTEFSISKNGLGGVRADCIECRNNYIRYKKKINPLFKLKLVLRHRLCIAVKMKKWHKNIRFNDYIGCSLEELKKHLESQFQPKMSWENHGIYGWHIDHIIPLASAKTMEEMYKLCHYTNLQPLWAKDNRIKSDKIGGFKSDSRI